MIDAEVLRQVAGNAAPVRSLRPELPTKTPLVSKYQSARHPSESSIVALSPGRSPGRPKPSSRQVSPSAARVLRQASNDQISTLAITPEYETIPTQSQGNGYFGSRQVDFSRGANKYGPVEGIALQITTGHPRTRRSNENKLGNTLYQATNSSHISLQKKPSHGRRRDRSQNGSKDTAAGSSISSVRSDRSRREGRRSPTQKNMLSQALAKANQAVLLDNAQNIQGAIEAYHEACDILEQVMTRSNDIDDRKKLSAIRATYSTRIAELYDLDNSFDYLNIDKELPEAPTTTRYLDGQDRISFEDPDDNQSSIEYDDQEHQRTVQIPLRQESLLPQIYGGEEYIEHQPPPSRVHPPPLNHNLAVPMDAKYMPPPLSPRRPLSPVQVDEQTTPVAGVQSTGTGLAVPTKRRSGESVSWLEMGGDENNSSVTSSRRSSIALANEDHDLVSAISAMEADIDAALEAAYDDEDYAAEATPRPSDVANMSSYHQEASLPQTKNSTLPTLITQTSEDSLSSYMKYEDLTREYLDEEAEEEEELLEMMMADGYAISTQNQNSSAMSSLPRQSDSSSFSARSSGRTWESSATAATQGTALSTLAESPEMPQHKSQNDLKEVEESTLPAQDVNVLSRKQASPLPPLPAADKNIPLRDRRLSGQSAKQLKIETFARRPSISQQGQPAPAPLLGIPADSHQQHELNRSASNTNMSVSTLPMTPLTSIHSADSTESTEAPALTQLLSNSTIADESFDSQTTDAQVVPAPRKNTSSSNLRPRNLSLATADLTDLPATPGSALFPIHSRSGNSISTPVLPNPSPNVLTGTTVGGMYIFEQIASPASPTSPRSPFYLQAEPWPLEPCPESFLLRPFWLMRCLYQTLAHPKGGFISNKLFIPREIWRVKNIKIKAIDEKSGQCDVLTAALLKLAKVDTLDADAVLEELQSFDSIIDSVRQALKKKLGNDVGLDGSAVAMNKSPAGDDQDANGSKPASSVKSIASSWRKLRSKSSAPALTPAMIARKDVLLDTTMPSLPMTSSAGVPTSRSYKAQKQPPPTPTGMPHVPPQHANYMSSLARLFDAVQVLDSIARQVEDPGLKATSKTQVGLELSIRGAAEFFSFYVIRFAMTDIGLLIDKYLKRNGEWVMS